MLARGAAAEIRPRDQDLRIAKLRLIEHEVRLLFAFGREAEIVEQPLSQPFALHGGQELLRNDLIGVDIAPSAKEPRRR